MERCECCGKEKMPDDLELVVDADNDVAVMLCHPCIDELTP